MNYFTDDFIKFFLELEKNNNRDWFAENKKRYEKSVKKPFYHFINELIIEINQLGGSLLLEAKDCVLRINRDIRFAKDKTPYNTHYTAFVSSGGRKDKNIPGIFIRLSASEIGIMGGCFGPDKEQLSRIRSFILDNKSEFEKAQRGTFEKVFGEIKGEVQKRMPPEFKNEAEVYPAIARKQFYYTAMLDKSLITDSKLMDRILDNYKAMKPMNDFLITAISQNELK